jgi:hypothetical protein
LKRAWALSADEIGVGFGGGGPRGLRETRSGCFSIVSCFVSSAIGASACLDSSGFEVDGEAITSAMLATELRLRLRLLKLVTRVRNDLKLSLFLSPLPPLPVPDTPLDVGCVGEDILVECRILVVCDSCAD